MSATAPVVAASMAGFAMRSAMAGVFVIATIHALRDHEEYTRIVQAYRILPEALSPPVAMLLPPCECGIAIALVLPATRVIGSLGGLAMLACFTVAIALNLKRGRRDIACGCGGGTGQTVSWALVLRNVLLFAGLAASLAAPVHPPLEAAATVGIAGIASFLVTLYLAANQLMVNAQLWPRATAGVPA